MNSQNCRIGKKYAKLVYVGNMFIFPHIPDAPFKVIIESTLDEKYLNQKQNGS